MTRQYRKKLKLQRENPHIRDRYVKESPNYEEDHIYLIRNVPHTEKGYKSVTTFIKQYFEDFDADAIIEKYYDKWQQSQHPEYFEKNPDEIKQMWEDNRDDAATKGTHMHLQFEMYLNDEPVDYCPEFPMFLNWMESHKLKAWRTEMTVYHPKYKIVGNIDLIAQDENGDFVIVDYKRAEPKYGTFGKQCKYGLPYPHNDITKHQLQLNIYKQILEEKYGLKIKGLYNLYIKDGHVLEFKEQQIMEDTPKWMELHEE